MSELPSFSRRIRRSDDNEMGQNRRTNLNTSKGAETFDMITCGNMNETKTFITTVNNVTQNKSCDALVQARGGSPWSLLSGLYSPSNKGFSDLVDIRGISFAPAHMESTESTNYYQSRPLKSISSLKVQRVKRRNARLRHISLWENYKLKQLGLEEVERRFTLKRCEKRFTQVTVDTSVFQEFFPYTIERPLSVNLNLPLAHRTVFNAYVPLNDFPINREKYVPNEIALTTCIRGYGAGETKQGQNYSYSYGTERMKPHECKASSTGGSFVLKKTYTDYLQHSNGTKMKSESRICTETVVKESPEDLETMNDYAGWDHGLEKNRESGFFEPYSKVFREQSFTEVKPSDTGPGTRGALLPACLVHGENKLALYSNSLSHNVNTLVDITNYEHPYSVIEDNSERGFIHSFRAALNADARSDENNTLSVMISPTGEEIETMSAIGMQKDGNPLVIRSELGIQHFAQGCQEHMKIWQNSSGNTRVFKDSLSNSSLKPVVEKNKERILNKPLPGFCNICQLTYINIMEHRTVHGESSQNDADDGEIADMVVAGRDSSVESYLENLMISEDFEKK